MTFLSCPKPVARQAGQSKQILPRLSVRVKEEAAEERKGVREEVEARLLLGRLPKQFGCAPCHKFLFEALPFNCTDCAGGVEVEEGGGGVRVTDLGWVSD